MANTVILSGLVGVMALWSSNSVADDQTIQKVPALAIEIQSALHTVPPTPCASVPGNPGKPHLPPELLDRLRPYLKTLSREVYTWHYVKKEALDINPSELLSVTAPRLTEHAARWSSYYWDLGQTYTHTHRKGLYAATNPYSSRSSFGGDSWLLFELVLPKGHRFIDIRAVDGTDDQWLTDREHELLGQAGCHLDRGVDRWDYFLMRSWNEGCTRAQLEVFKQLAIDSVVYGWGSTAVEGVCDIGEAASFVILDSKKVSSKRVYWEKSRRTSDAERLQELFGRYPVNHSDGSAARLPRDSNGKIFLWSNWPVPLREETIPWVKEHIFGCGSYSEDSRPNRSGL